MAAPKMKPAAREGAAGDGAEDRDNTRNIPQTGSRVQWEVQVVNPLDGKPKRWDVYTNRDGAESVAATLRRHKFFVQIRRVDDEAAPVAKAAP